MVLWSLGPYASCHPKGLHSQHLGLMLHEASPVEPESQVLGMPRPSNYPLLDSKYHQIRTIGFQLRVVGGSRWIIVPYWDLIKSILRDLGGPSAVRCGPSVRHTAYPDARILSPFLPWGSEQPKAAPIYIKYDLHTLRPKVNIMYISGAAGMFVRFWGEFGPQALRSRGLQAIFRCPNDHRNIRILQIQLFLESPLS